MNVDPIRTLLGGEHLQWLVERLRSRMSRGEALTGKVQLSAATAEQREAVDKLFGRTPSHGTSLTVDLDSLAAMLARAQACTKLEDAVVQLVGPVPNERAESLSVQQQWDSLWEDANARAKGNPQLHNWLEDVRVSGLLKRFAAGDLQRARALIVRAVSIVSQVPLPAVRLAELAASETGNSHSLDRGQPLASLVIRFAVQLDKSAKWKTTMQRREAWELLGVLCDEVSAPVLVLNLRADNQSLTGQALNLHASAGEPYRLSVRQLRRHPPAFDTVATGSDIYVCENPTVVDVAANQFGDCCQPLICIDGQPKTASRFLLNALSEAGCTIHYHGDFDWDGVRIGNTIMHRHGAISWRFNACDYSSASHSDHELKGNPITAHWDPELAPLMERRGISIHEEQVLDDLLSDLA